MLYPFLFSALALGDDRDDFFAWQSQLAERRDRLSVSMGYRSAPDAFTEIATAVAAHPGTVEVERIGYSHRGVPLWAFHVTGYPEPTERKILVIGGIHAMEWLGVEVATDTLLWLLARPEPGIQVTVVPLLNPDGRAKVERDLEDALNVFRRGNDQNIDLNRDFSVNTEVRAVWSAIIPAYYAHSETPLSQPESRALDRLAARERYDRAVSLHTFGGFLYYPWAGLWASPPDERDFQALGRAMEQAQGRHAYKTRQLSRWGFFFRAHGAEIDHLYGRYGTRAFLIELSRSGVRPLHLLADLRSNFRLYNPLDPKPHRERGFRAVRTLIQHPTLPSEKANPPGTPREPTK